MGDKLIECWTCTGHGSILMAFSPITIPCDRCGGDGSCPEIMLQWAEEGRKLKDHRIERRVTLRDAAKLANISVMLLSNIERGIVNPNDYKEIKETI